MNWLFQSRDYSEALSAAKQHVESIVDGATVHNATLRVEEPERWVFAVFYTTPDVMIKPTPYRIVAVSKSKKIAEELPYMSDSRYWILGRK